MDPLLFAVFGGQALVRLRETVRHDASPSTHARRSRLLRFFALRR